MFATGVTARGVLAAVRSLEDPAEIATAVRGLVLQCDAASACGVRVVQSDVAHALVQFAAGIPPTHVAMTRAVVGLLGRQSLAAICGSLSLSAAERNVVMKW